MTASPTLAPPRTETEVIAHGWKVFRAAQMTEWPREHAREIGRAVTTLWTELDMHGRLNADKWVGAAAPVSRARHAAAALERAAEVTALLERYCGGAT